MDRLTDRDDERARRTISEEDPYALDMVCRVLSDDGSVQLPTDTVDGIVCSAMSEIAVSRLRRLLDLDDSAPLTIMIAVPEMLRAFALVTPWAMTAMAEFWPGPLTMVLDRVDCCESAAGGHSSISLRVPRDSFVRRALFAFGPLAVTSARPIPLPESQNLVSPLLVTGTKDSTERRSTIVDARVPRLLREGAISSERLGLVRGSGR